LIFGGEISPSVRPERCLLVSLPNAGESRVASWSSPAEFLMAKTMGAVKEGVAARFSSLFPRCDFQNRGIE
jgi:hypothetical protein